MSRVLAALAMLAQPLCAADTKPAPKWRPLFDGKKAKLFKEVDYPNSGKVLVKDGAIRLEAGKPMTGIVYAGKDFPTMDYEVEMEAMKVEGIDFFATTTFPVGKTHCSFVVGGWSGNVTGLSTVDFADASMNETTKEVEYKKGKWYRLRIRVTKERIQAWVDKERVVDLDTKDRDIGTRIECRACRPFGIATYRTTGAVRNLRVRELMEAEKKAK